MFFYSLVYDPTQKTLLADKGEIRVGPRFQADVPDMLQEGRHTHTHRHIYHTFFTHTLTPSDCMHLFVGESDEWDQSKLEEKLWDPDCPLSSKQIDQFLVVARYDI